MNRRSANLWMCCSIDKSSAHSISSCLSGRDEIDLVINLTIPAAHAGVKLRVLSSGKHVYSEKPLALSRGDGRAFLNTAEANGLRVGCAPDTFLGAGGQTSRRGVDGWFPVDPVGMADVQRAIGVAEIARAISNGTKHAASGDLAFHVLDVMEAFEESSREGRPIRLTSRVDRPAHF